MSEPRRIDVPGVYDLTAEEYHGDPAPEPSLSSSGARLIMSECPAIYWHERNHPPPPSDAFVIGSAAHEWLLEGERWPQRHRVLPADHNGSTKDGKARVRAIADAGLRAVRHDDFEAIKAMKAALEAHEWAGAAFQNGRAETSAFWIDRRFGIWCRCRPDFMPSRGTIIPDYKTCTSANPEHIRKDIARFGYHQQAAWYCDGIAALGLIERPTFLFVFQAKTPPYLVTCITLDEDTLEWGRMLNHKAKATFAECLRTGRWPGYADDIITLGLPGWESKRLQDMSDLGRLAIEAQAPVGWSQQ